MAIDVGAACTNRGTYQGGSSRTFVERSNPANGTGTIDYVCMYVVQCTTPTDVDIASFSASGNTLTTNGSITVSIPSAGQKIYNAPGDFTAFGISTGEYIGGYLPSNVFLEADNSGGTGIWYATGDHVPCTDIAFDAPVYINWEMSLYATGVTAGWIGKINGVTNPAKIMGVAVASIAKVMGI